MATHSCTRCSACIYTMLWTLCKCISSLVFPPHFACHRLSFPSHLRPFNIDSELPSQCRSTSTSRRSSPSRLQVLAFPPHLTSGPTTAYRHQTVRRGHALASESAIFRPRDDPSAPTQHVNTLPPSHAAHFPPQKQRHTHRRTHRLSPLQRPMHPFKFPFSPSRRTKHNACHSAWTLHLQLRPRHNVRFYIFFTTTYIHL